MGKIKYVGRYEGDDVTNPKKPEEPDKPDGKIEEKMQPMVTDPLFGQKELNTWEGKFMDCR